MKRVKCDSGLTGWQCRLQENYADCAEPFKAFKAYCRIYGNHRRLGYRSMKAAWEANPVIQGSTNPSDYRKVRD